MERDDIAEDLRGRLREFQDGDEPIFTTLQTDERVIARITDGIYRQPASALRELISNAYDADATQVTIKTDRPRFDRITIEDNGNGMSSDTLVHVLHHIGGSSKRTSTGVRMGVTAENPRFSPKGRRLIGKIGIGLFSVAQLTHSFELITKVKGEHFRTVARVNLRQYTDDAANLDSDTGQKYEAGKVILWRVPAHDIESQGTTVVLDSVRIQTKQTLRSADRWDAVERTESEGIEHGLQREGAVQPPRFFIGSVRSDDVDLLRPGSESGLPWSSGDSPTAAFSKLVNSVESPALAKDSNPTIDKVLDEYLQMVWLLSLWCPLPYFASDPFGLANDDEHLVFRFDRANSRLEPVQGGRSVGDAVGRSALTDTENFSVRVDDLELRRPIRVSDFPETSAIFQTPIIAAGTFASEFSGVQKELSGGPLKFNGYLLWSPKVTPVEHRGVLIRVNNATGMRFDPGFLDFPSGEKTRMSQITAEVFIEEGFDGALNIDRESFNFAHPHAVIVTRWVHAGLTRLIAAQKQVSSAAREKKKRHGEAVVTTNTDRIVEEIWERFSDGQSEPTPVTFVRSLLGGEGGEDSEIVLPYDVVRVPTTSATAKSKMERTITAITQILDAVGALDSLSGPDRAALLGAIRDILVENGI